MKETISFQAFGSLPSSEELHQHSFLISVLLALDGLNLYLVSIPFQEISDELVQS